ncbi:MAG: sigma-70 family RNA polymerase sigma factor [Prevotella sp.]|nr:sigma-70 family RNA polymerase sigma factor [Prevotella sp.]
MNDKKAFEQLFRDNYARLYQFANRMVNDPEACRDIVSEAFAQAYPKMDAMEDSRRLAFLYTLVRNKCVDHVRHEVAQQKYASLMERAYAEDPDELSAIISEQDELLKQAGEVMQEMTPKTRLILERCYLQRKKYREVAEELGISNSAVRKHIVAALKKLRERMAKKSE